MGSNPTGGMDVCCECCVLSCRGLCDGLITRPEESYRPWRVAVCDQETSNTRRLSEKKVKNVQYVLLTEHSDEALIYIPHIFSLLTRTGTYRMTVYILVFYEDH